MIYMFLFIDLFINLFSSSYSRVYDNTESGGRGFTKTGPPSVEGSRQSEGGGKGYPNKGPYSVAGSRQYRERGEIIHKHKSPRERLATVQKVEAEAIRVHPVGKTRDNTVYICPSTVGPEEGRRKADSP